MAEPKSKLFRAGAMDRLSSTEDLENLMPVAGPREWVLILAAGALMVLFVAWCFAGSVPTTVGGRGVILRPDQVMQVQTTVGGRIAALSVRPGDRIRQGDLIATVDQSDIVKRLEENRLNLKRLEEQDGHQNLSEQHQLALQTIQDGTEQSGLDAQRTSLEKNLGGATGLRPILAQQANAYRDLVKEGLMSAAAAEISSAESAVVDNEAKIRSYTAQLSQLDAQLRQIETRGAALSRQFLNDSLVRRGEMEQIRRNLELEKFQLQRDGKIQSPYSGRVAEVMAAVGQVMPAGARLFTLELDSSSVGLESVSYFPVRDGKKIQPGMQLQIVPDTVERERFGGILGTVSSVSPAPVTKEGVLRTIGNTEVVQNLMPDGVYLEIRARLEPDPSTFSGYKWSSSRGPQMKIGTGLTHSVRVKVDGRAPVTYLLPILREITGVY